MDTPAHDALEAKRSRVRRWLSYMAGLFIFVGGGGLSAWFMVLGKHEYATNIFNTVLAIAAGIVGYWFASKK